MHVQKSDSLLVSKILKGNTDLYRILVDRYSPMLFHIVRSFEKNEEEVKGLVQEIFVKAYTRLDTFREQSKFSSWIYSIGLNHCRDYARNIRRSDQRFSELEDGFIEQKASEMNQPDQDIEKTERKMILYRAIEKLKPEQSEPLLMKYRDGMSYKTISEQMNISESALKVRVHRARAELKNLIGNEAML